ncbi:ABC transporter permease [Winogradskyella rapida]|uniref:ABC transporter permease n=1 Tax=Winogradskyella rapida TaxID=549701 RepID=A0ABW3KPI7_9FLAO
MNVWKISWQNIRSKPLYTFLSIGVLTLSITLLLGIQQIKYAFKNQIETNLGNIDLVIGAKGSPLQLVLASVLHLDNPTGNISYAEARKIIKNPRVKSAVPMSYGDNYKGYRIVGTTEAFLSIYKAELETGRYVAQSMEVVLGASVAQSLNLKLGDTFLSSHGLVENSVDVHNDELTIVGILKPTHKVIDRLIVTNLESIWEVHHHEDEHQSHEDHEHHHHHDDGAEEREADKDITSLLVKFKSARSLLNFPRKINESTNLLAALPSFELHKLYEYTSVGFKTITWIAYVILVMSGLTIFISLYKMVKERAFDLAILRTYGASNFQLIKMVLYEGLMIAFLAFVIGYFLVKIGLTVGANYMFNKSQQNLLIDLPLQELLYVAVLIFMMVILSVSLAIYPIIKMNISTILSHEK